MEAQHLSSVLPAMGTTAAWERGYPPFLSFWSVQHWVGHHIANKFVSAFPLIWCLGAVFPVFARRRLTHPLMEYGFFFAKYFGSGVIIATAFIHVSYEGTFFITAIADFD